MFIEKYIMSIAENFNPQNWQLSKIGLNSLRTWIENTVNRVEKPRLANKEKDLSIAVSKERYTDCLLGHEISVTVDYLNKTC